MYWFDRGETYKGPHHNIPNPHPNPSPHSHHLVERNVRMKFGRQWYRGVVTDHDVSTDAELIWHVKFDDGDECDLIKHLRTPPYPSPRNPSFSLFNHTTHNSLTPFSFII
jgi:hypothetical protein